MICSRCARRLALSSIPLGPSIRHFSSTIAKRTQNLPPSTKDPLPATSTSAAQPFSTPFTPSPARSPDFPPDSSITPTPPAPKSSVKAGTLLKGLGYIKGKDSPVAKEDHEYPEWLWGLLDKTEKVSGVRAVEEGADEFGESWFSSCLLGGRKNERANWYCRFRTCQCSYLQRSGPNAWSSRKTAIHASLITSSP